MTVIGAWLVKTNNKSSVLQFRRINEVLLNMDRSLSLPLLPAAVQCKSSTDLHHLCGDVGLNRMTTIVALSK